MSKKYLEPTRNVFAVILAAGKSSRFGSNKMLASFVGKPLIVHAVSAAAMSDVQRVIVVLGQDADMVRTTIEANIQNSVRIQYITNHGYAAGLAGSLKKGLQACVGQSEAAMLLLGDQPLVTACLIQRMLGAHSSNTPTPLVAAPVYQATRGNPVLVDSSLYQEILDTVTGDKGAREVLARHYDRTLFVPTGPEAVLDVDTVSDHQTLSALAGSGHTQSPSH